MALAIEIRRKQLGDQAVKISQLPMEIITHHDRSPESDWHKEATPEHVAGFVEEMEQFKGICDFVAALQIFNELWKESEADHPALLIDEALSQIDDLVAPIHLRTIKEELEAHAKRFTEFTGIPYPKVK